MEVRYNIPDYEFKTQFGGVTYLPTFALNRQSINAIIDNEKLPNRHLIVWNIMAAVILSSFGDPANGEEYCLHFVPKDLISVGKLTLLSIFP